MNKTLSFTFFLTILITFTIAQNNETTVGVSPNINDIKGCPFPMISLKSEGLSKTDTSLCLDDCCLPCPIINNFYKKGQIDLIYNVLSVIRVISFTCILIIVTSYIVLPNKRESSTLTVLYFNLSLLIFLGVTFFYLGNLKRVQCADLITQSTLENNILCGVQGIVLIFSLFLLILWCFLLILHLHFQTVWNSNIIQKYFNIAQVLVILIASVFTILSVVLKMIVFEFGAVCLTSSKLSNELLWYPLAIFVIPGFTIHFCTFIHIGKSQFSLNQGYEDSVDDVVSTKESRSITDLVRAVKVQWRAFMLALLLLTAYMIYWSYDVFELGKIKGLFETVNKPLWFQTWFNCIYENGVNEDAQSICSIHAKDHIPNIAFLATAESLLASLGISMFFVFGTSIDLWSEWRMYFMKKFDGVSGTLNGNTCP